MQYDAPGNRELLEMIQAGRAPHSLFGVAYNQPMQLIVSQKTSEEYRPQPKKAARAFEGSGNRLGSPAPEISGSGSSSPTMPGGMTRPQSILQGSATLASASQTAAAPVADTRFEVDESKPTTSVQMRLGDGTRCVTRRKTQ